jgi:hypothetical protein
MEPYIIHDEITVNPEDFSKLVYYVAGAVSAVFMQRDPDMDFAVVAEEVKAAAVNGVEGWLDECPRT